MCAFTPLCSCVPSRNESRSWGSVRHVMPPWRRVHIINHLDNVFPGERHHVAPSWVFVKFCTPGEGPQDHETLHHVIVLEFVPDGVLLVWAGLLKQSLEVVCRWLHPTSEPPVFLTLPSS
jgi:hypothetical protein